MLKTKKVSEKKLEILSRRLNYKWFIFQGMEKVIAVGTDRYVYYLENVSYDIEKIVNKFADWPPANETIIVI